jgi:ABC-type Fe3+-citrate transport system substrate-binding protein|tara:strand:- start:100 stop:321 length:222 start_codon:yes stop_codon:yes gene_type:complete
MSYLKVEGHGELYRDSTTNSIVNRNTSDYNRYMSQKKTRNKEVEKVDTMEQDLAHLKNEINEIKSLLKELVNG